MLGSADWPSVWQEFAQLGRLSPGTPEFRELAGDLMGLAIERDQTARKQKDKMERFRAGVLSRNVARLSNAPWNPIPEPGVEVIFVPGEAWCVARVVVGGRTRDRALVQALTEAAPEELGERVAFAAAALNEGLLAPRLEDAEPLARAIDRSAPSAASARDLARVLTLHGDIRAARSVLLDRIAATEDPTSKLELLAALGEIELGAGADVEAATALGSAYARGSVTAGLLLARESLVAGETARARALYRALSAEDSTRPGTQGDTARASALRGWGLANLTFASSAPVTDDAARP